MKHTLCGLASHSHCFECIGLDQAEDDIKLPSPPCLDGGACPGETAAVMGPLFAASSEAYSVLKNQTEVDMESLLNKLR